MKKWIIVLLVLVGLYLIGSVIALIAFNDNVPSGDKIAIISINGVIGGSSSFLNDQSVSSAELVKTIRSLNKDESVKGIIFEINSPGGTVVASEEIANAIKDLNKTNYAVIRDAGASGAYWIASASDRIFASPMSVTGSIGVLGSYLEFSELFDKYGITYERLIGGKYKDLGSPYKELDDEERELLQSKIDLIHEYFIQQVAINRNMSVDRVRGLATGEFFLGVEAKELGLIDEIGNRETALTAIKKELNLTKIDVSEQKKEKSFLDLILNNVAYQFGRGFAATFLEFSVTNRYEIRA